MKKASWKERKAMERALMEQMRVDVIVNPIAEAEQRRWAGWEAVAPSDRMKAIGVAGLPRERADDTASMFTDAERAQIRTALAAHIGRMEFIIQCMNPSNTTRQGYLH